MSKVDIHPTFKNKQVYNLECLFCGTIICRRGMKAVLLADTKTEMYSTDIPQSDAIDVVEPEVSTTHCACKIQHLACLTCGNEVGYTVSRPCRRCLMSCNNGHFWMYFSVCVKATERVDKSGEELLLWGELPCAREDHSIFLEIECCR